MALLKRIGWYLVGLSIGLIFLVFFLKKKSEETGVEFCYFPNCRVLKDLRSKPFILTETAKSQMVSENLDTVVLKSFLRDGDVDFDRSDTQSVPCKTYYVSKKLKGKNLSLEIKSCEDKVIVETLHDE